MVSDFYGLKQSSTRAMGDRISRIERRPVGPVQGGIKNFDRWTRVHGYRVRRRTALVWMAVPVRLMCHVRKGLRNEQISKDDLSDLWN
jgi:hypothetical protein